MAHAKLSPSASSRWMVCPGSVHLEPDSADSGSSVYAEKGTAMHEVAELCLTKDLDPNSFIGKKVNGYTIDQDMSDLVRVYTNYIQSLNGQKFYEEKVTLLEIINDCWGTADCVVIDGTLMRVIDLKTGSGVKVDAEENSQLMCYALGAYLKYRPAYDIETITLTIVQPPKNSIDSWTIPVEQLMAFAEDLKRSYAAIQNEPTKFVLSEKGCAWCRSKSQCPEMQRMANQAAAEDFKELDSNSIEDWLPKIANLKLFIEAVESKAKETLFSGGTVKGWKVVEGRKSRDWLSVEKTEAYLKGQGYDSIYTKPELLSVAQMEKALKGEHLDLTELIKVSYGSPTIAPESDKRPAVDKSLSAKKDFAES